MKVAILTDTSACLTVDKIKELNGGKTVNAVFVVGGGGKIPGFTKLLAKELDLPETRVALRGKEVLENVEFAVDNVKKDPLYVTPVGICINYYNQRNNFIAVTVNGNKIKLYDNSKLTVIDAVMQAGYPNEKLFPRRGPAVEYTLNGVHRMIRGESGNPAVILKNGKETTLMSEIMKNDYIDIEESTVGKEPEMRLDELQEFNTSVTFNVNGNNIACPRYAYVNGEIQSGNYIIKNGDNIIMEDYYTVEQLFKFLDIPVDDKKIIVNNDIAAKDTPVYPNFNVKYQDMSEMSYDELEADDRVKETDVDDRPENVSHSTISVKVNNTYVTLTGKESYTFVDILDVYPFDMSKMGGDELVMTIDKVKAEFVSPLHNGAEVELYWK